MAVQLKNLTIDVLKEYLEGQSYITLLNPGGDLFQAGGLLIDVQSINVLVTIYNALKAPGQAKFNDVLQSEYKLARLLDSMWEMVK